MLDKISFKSRQCHFLKANILYYYFHISVWKIFHIVLSSDKHVMSTCRPFWKSVPCFVDKNRKQKFFAASISSTGAACNMQQPDTIENCLSITTPSIWRKFSLAKTTSEKLLRMFFPWWSNWSSRKEVSN